MAPEHAKFASLWRLHKRDFLLAGRYKALGNCGYCHCYHHLPSLNLSSEAQAGNTTTKVGLHIMPLSSSRNRNIQGMVGRVLPTRHMNIYTKTGDKGTSALFSGERRKKSDLRFEALGAVDELSSFIGLSIAFVEESKHTFVNDLINIQCILQDIGSFIATPSSSARDSHMKKLHFDTSAIDKLERSIDKMTEELPALTNFILPSGGKASSSLHLSRAVCRRAERHLAELLFTEDINVDVYKYINRLSDYMFTLARYVAMLEGQKEHIYRPTKSG